MRQQGEVSIAFPLAKLGCELNKLRIRETTVWGEKKYHRLNDIGHIASDAPGFVSDFFYRPEMNFCDVLIHTFMYQNIYQAFTNEGFRGCIIRGNELHTSSLKPAVESSMARLTLRDFKSN